MQTIKSEKKEKEKTKTKQNRTQVQRSRAFMLYRRHKAVCAAGNHPDIFMVPKVCQETIEKLNFNRQSKVWRVTIQK